MTLSQLVESRLPTFFSGGWRLHKERILHLLEHEFGPPYLLDAAAVGRLEDLLSLQVKDERRRKQYLGATLESLNAAGLVTSPIPVAPLPSRVEGAVPRDRRVIALAGRLDSLLDAIDSSSSEELAALTVETFVAVTFLSIVAGCAVCPTIAISCIAFACSSDLRGARWLWTSSSPASESSHSALILPKAVRKLISAAKARFSVGPMDHIFLPPELRVAYERVSRPDRCRLVGLWIRDSLERLCSATTTNCDTRVGRWRGSLDRDLLQMLGRWQPLEEAARYRLFRKCGLPPCTTEMLFMPVLPSAPVHAKFFDKLIGTSKRSAHIRYEFDAGVPPQAKTEALVTEGLSPDDELDPTERVASPSAWWSTHATGILKSFVAQVAVLQRGHKSSAQYPDYLRNLVVLRDQTLASLSGDLPQTSIAHLLIRWMAHRFEVRTQRPETIRLYLSRFGPTHLFHDSLPADLGEWTADDVYDVVAAFLCDSRAASTQFSAVGLFAEFVRYCQLTSSNLLFPDVRLVRGTGDLDFDRRTVILSDQKFWRLIGRLATAKSSHTRRAALSYILMGGLGLRAIEAHALEEVDLLFEGDLAVVKVRFSKTMAGARSLRAHDWLSSDQLQLFRALVEGLRTGDPSNRICVQRRDDGSPLSYGTSRKRLIDLLRRHVHKNDGKDEEARFGTLIDLHSLRHRFATIHLLRLLKSMRGNTDWRTAPASAFVHFLKALGHRNHRTLLVHYFHAGEELRRLLLMPDLEDQPRGALASTAIATGP